MSSTPSASPAIRIIFMGTAGLACASLTALCQDASFQVVAVVSQPDKPKGRDLKVQFTPVKAIAVAQGLPVLQPERARNESFIEQLRNLQPELIVVAAYGQILPQAILDLPRRGCLNVHASLLPKYRGAAPIAWAILSGEPETGVTIMKMDAGLDTGAIVSQVTTPIAPTDNALTLQDRLAKIGAELLVKTIPGFVGGRITPRPQPGEGASYARKITKEDGCIDWSRPARVVWLRVRGFNPWPGAFTRHSAGGRTRLLKIWSAEVEPECAAPPGTIVRADKNGIIIACGEQGLRVLQLQFEGGRQLGFREFLAGNELVVGSRLGLNPNVCL